MKIFNLCLIILFSTQFFACATPYHKAQQKISISMDKSDILEIMDSPKYTYRKNSTDYWVYRYYQNHTEQELTVIFQYGEVIKIKGPTARPRLLRQAEAAKNYKSYEIKVRQYQDAQKM